jgi:hypothetical protein
MKTLNATLAICLVVTAADAAGPQVQARKSWAPASYHGLIMGKSTRDDVRRVLGKPKWVGKEGDTGVPIMNYDVSDPVPGTLVAHITNGILESMELDLKKSLPKNDVIRLLGSGYIVVHYSMDDCLGEGGTTPIYEDPNGPIVQMEYRDRGLAASFYNDRVEAIIYTDKPFGPTHSQCKGRSRKK